MIGRATFQSFRTTRCTRCYQTLYLHARVLGSGLWGTRLDKGHEKRYKEVSENQTMESFAVEHVSNLTSKIILAVVAMSNFITKT